MGWLISYNTMQYYDVELVNVASSCVLGCKLKHKKTDYKLGLFVVYVPPEGSRYDMESITVYDELLLQTYATVNWDQLLMVGDFNARVGDVKDFCNSDDIQTRNIIDSTINSHGWEMLNFLIESKCCIINGRVGCGTQCSSEFTLENSRGRSVVDYGITRHTDLDMVWEFRVVPCDQLFENGSNISTRSRLPDHKALICVLKTSNFHNVSFSRMLGAPRNKRNLPIRKVPMGYMSSETASRAVVKLIECFENMHKSQEEVDTSYSELLSLIDRELNSEAKKTHPGKRVRVPVKPYWNKKLSDMWHEVDAMNKLVNKLKKQGANRSQIEDAKRLSKQLLHAFDKEHRKVKQKFLKGNQIKMEELVDRNPRSFWRKVNSLGPQKTEIPWRIDSPDRIITDKEQISEAWAVAFENLYRNEGKL